MQAWWIPIECNDLLSDSIHFDRDVKFLVAVCRRHGSFMFNKKVKMAIEKCELCGTDERLSVHHIRPLWAYAVEYLCESLLIGERVKIIEKRDGVYSEWNGITNLLTVCYTCHSEIEKEADREWKLKLIEKYYPHLCDGYQEVRKNYAKFWRK